MFSWCCCSFYWYHWCTCSFCHTILFCIGLSLFLFLVLLYLLILALIISFIFELLLVADVIALLLLLFVMIIQSSICCCHHFSLNYLLLLVVLSFLEVNDIILWSKSFCNNFNILSAFLVDPSPILFLFFFLVHPVDEISSHYWWFDVSFLFRVSISQY